MSFHIQTTKKFRIANYYTTLHETPKVTMDLPVLPPRPIESFPTFASTIESDILPVKSIETEAPKRPINSTQQVIEGR